jgi:adenosylcobinamide-GDP ribazoletransferase
LGFVGLTWVIGLTGLTALSALAGILFLAAATRLLHWDGLADVGDAWFAPQGRRLDILRDTHTGAFGVFALAFGLLAYYVLLETLLSSEPIPVWGLVGVPVFGRTAAMFAAWFGTPVRSEGLGAAVSGRPAGGSVVIALFALVAAGAILVSIGGYPLWLPALCVIVALVVPHLISLRFGGVTGDVMGASVVITELCVLLVLTLEPTLSLAVT